VTPHSLFSRKGADVHLKVPITVSQAVLGGSVQIPTIDDDVELKIPAGTQPNEQRVLRNRGLPRLNDRSSRGHQYVHFNVIVPSKLSENQKTLMTEFGKEEVLQTANEGKKGVFGRLKDFLSHKKD
jgi:molecular chaperone DnaJ